MFIIFIKNKIIKMWISFKKKNNIENLLSVSTSFCYTIFQKISLMIEKFDLFNINYY